MQLANHYSFERALKQTHVRVFLNNYRGKTMKVVFYSKRVPTISLYIPLVWVNTMAHARSQDLDDKSHLPQ